MTYRDMHTKNIADLGSKVRVIRAAKIHPIIINNIVWLNYAECDGLVCYEKCGFSMVWGVRAWYDGMYCIGMQGVRESGHFVTSGQFSDKR